MNDHLKTIQTLLAPIYRADRQYSYAEECLCLEIVRNPKWREEVDTVIDYWNSLPENKKQFFPQSMNRLLSSWAETLDRAAVAKRLGPAIHDTATSIKILWNEELRRVEKKIQAIRDANKTDPNVDIPWSKEDRAEIKTLKARRDELKTLLGFRA